MREWQIYIEYLELSQKIYWIECDDERVMQVNKQEYEILKGLFDQLKAAEKEAKAGKRLYIDAQKRCKAQALRGDTLEAERDRLGDELRHLRGIGPGDSAIAIIEELEAERDKLGKLLRNIFRYQKGFHKGDTLYDKIEQALKEQNDKRH